MLRDRSVNGSRVNDRLGTLTPSTRVGVIDGGINIAQVNLAHETIDLDGGG